MCDFAVKIRWYSTTSLRPRGRGLWFRYIFELYQVLNLITLQIKIPASGEA